MNEIKKLKNGEFENITSFEVDVHRLYTCANFYFCTVINYFVNIALQHLDVVRDATRIVVSYMD